MGIWLDGWTRQELSGLTGKNYQYNHNPKLCVHTTEGTSINGAVGAYSPYPPHGIYHPLTRERRQHISLDRAAYSAMDGNDDDFMIQIEIVGFAAGARGLDDSALRNIAEDVFRPIMAVMGIPANYLQTYDTQDMAWLASPQSPIRISAAQLRDFSGVLGHQHLPAPDSHWDPGKLNLARILEFAEEDMTPDQANKLQQIYDQIAYPFTERGVSFGEALVKFIDWHDGIESGTGYTPAAAATQIYDVTGKLNTFLTEHDEEN